MGRFAEFAEAETAAQAECVGEDDRGAYFAELNTHIALASRYEPAHDPQDRDAEGRVICAECGDAIEPARLEVLPHAIRCFPCQLEFDRVENALQRQFGGLR